MTLKRKLVMLTKGTWNGTRVNLFLLPGRVIVVKPSASKTATTNVSKGRSSPEDPRSSANEENLFFLSTHAHTCV